MDIQVQSALVGLGGVIIGGVIASIPIFIQQQNEHKRWLIERKIEYLKEQIQDIEENKKLILKDLHNVFNGKKFKDNHNFVSSVPMEVIEIFKKSLPDGKTEIQSLPKAKRDQLFIDVATALENKKIEMKGNIRKLLS